MPTRPPRICPSCRTPVTGPCPPCTRARDRARGTFRERGYTSAWDEVSKAFLKAHPLCIDHPAPGCTLLATQSDHDPHTRRELIAMGENPNDWRWLKPRCGPCHSRKTATHDGGFGNRPRPDQG